MKGKLHLWIGALLLVAAAVALRWPSLWREVWNLDEANAVVFAQQVLRGDVLYRDVVDTRGPLLVYALAAELRVIGDWNIAGVHLLLGVALGLTAFLLWRLVARLGGGGVFAAVVFTLACVLFIEPLDAFTMQPEWFVLCFSTLGFWLLCHAWLEGRPWLAAGSGVAFGLSYLTKQPGLFDAIAAATWMMLFVALDPVSRARRLKLLGALAAGMAVAVVAAGVYFWACGALPEYRFYAWTYSTRYYLPEVTLRQQAMATLMPLTLAWSRMPGFALAAAVAVVSVVWGLARSLRLRLAGQELPLLAVGWSVAGLLASGLAGREYSHYGIQAIPGFSLLSGWALEMAWRHGGGAIPRSRSFLWRGFVVLLIALAALPLAGLFQRPNGKPDPIKQVGEIVRRNTMPDERIFVWGFFPEINFHAQRLNASRFPSANFLTGLIPWTNLDPDKDTAYAVVPGAWDELWADFERHPPAIIVDTNSRRGYAKYPLARQPRLWDYVQDHYVEIEADQVRACGFRLYRRLGAPLSAAAIPIPDPALVVRPEYPQGAPTSSFPIRLPSGLTAAEIVVNGRSLGSIPLSPERTHHLMFVYRPAVHGRNPVIDVRAERPDRTLVAGPAYTVPDLPPQPTIIGGAVELPSLVSECLTGPLTWLAKEQVFSAHAPARLLFPRPKALLGVSFDFGLFDGAWAPERRPPTDGIELQVNFAPDRGMPRRLFTKAIYPQAVPADRGRQSVKVDLPPGETGRVEIVLSPGRQGDASSDWAYIGPITGRVMPLTLSDGARRSLAVDFDTPLGVAEYFEASQLVVLAHAPAAIEFELRPDMRFLAGDFCMAQSSWQNPKGHTAGIDFIVEQVAPGGRVTELWRQRLDPARVPADRGLHHFHFALPVPATGRLRLRSAAAHPPDNSYGYSCWANLTADAAP